jgi:hypothetical protein
MGDITVSAPETVATAKKRKRGENKERNGSLLKAPVNDPLPRGYPIQDDGLTWKRHKKEHTSTRDDTGDICYHCGEALKFSAQYIIQPPIYNARLVVHNFFVNNIVKPTLHDVKMCCGARTKLLHHCTSAHEDWGLFSSRLSGVRQAGIMTGRMSKHPPTSGLMCKL